MKFYRHRVDKAIAIIKGYCNKSTSCGNCRFGHGDGCPFTDGTLPCDWDVEEMIRTRTKEDGSN